MKVLVAGTGGLGGYYGARLAAAGDDVWFMARGENLRALRDHGLEVRSDSGDVHLPRVHAVENGAEAGPVDVVLFTVKTYDGPLAAEAAAGAVRQGTAVCTMQNGVDAHLVLEARFPEAAVLAAPTRVEAFLDSPGVVMQRGAMQDVTLGAFDDADRPVAQSLANALAGAGFPVTVTDDVLAALWLKLLIICGIGSITAYARRSIGDVLADAVYSSMLERLLREVAAVAAALDIAVPPAAPDLILAYARAQLDPGFKSSMLRDLEAGRPLEVEDLNGAVVRYGLQAGVPTPVNRTVLDDLLGSHIAALAARTGGPGPSPGVPAAP